MQLLRLREVVLRFISYYPLKQGLKPRAFSMQYEAWKEFISYYPLKQGLKLVKGDSKYFSPSKFISYYPLKQGLKRIHTAGRDLPPGYLYPTIH